MVQSVGKAKLDSGDGMGGGCHYSNRLGIGMPAGIHADKWCVARSQVKELHKKFFTRPVFQATSLFALKSQVLITSSSDF